VARLRELKVGPPARPIWLWGGGTLFRDAVNAGLVDGVDVAIVPVLLGGGIPLLPPPVASRLTLRLVRHRVYEKSGIVAVDYDVVPGAIVDGARAAGEE
jgi:dihydrofolate reductase